MLVPSPRVTMRMERGDAQKCSAWCLVRSVCSLRMGPCHKHCDLLVPGPGGMPVKQGLGCSQESCCPSPVRRGVSVSSEADAAQWAVLPGPCCLRASVMSECGELRTALIPPLPPQHTGCIWQSFSEGWVEQCSPKINDSYF